MAGFQIAATAVPLSGDGTSAGYVTVASAVGLFVTAVVNLSSATEEGGEYVIVSISGGQIGLRVNDSQNFGLSDVSAFHVADSARLDVPAQLIYGDTQPDPLDALSYDGETLDVLSKIEVPTPTLNAQAANKAYVDAVASGLDPKQSVRAATTGAITNLSSTSVSIDGVTLVEGDRVLVKNTASINGIEAVHAKRNGIYVVGVVAGGLAPLTRAADANTSAEVTSGLYCWVSEGAANGGSGWVLVTADPIVLDTNALTFTEFTGSYRLTLGSPANGLSLSGNTLSLAAAGAAATGAVTSSAQTFGGAKTFNDGLKLPSGQLVTSGAGAPVAGTWAVGDTVYNSAPAAGSVIGWVCTVAGIPGIWKTFSTISPATTASSTIYVATTGNDGNPGTLALPFLTIQAAINSIPKTIKHPTIVSIGAGTFAPFFVSGFNVAPDGNAQAYLEVQGTMAAATVATGTASGTSTAVDPGDFVAAFATLTDAGQTWTINDLKGKFLYITGGAGAGNVAVITSNTATVISVAGFFYPIPDATSTYAIKQSGTVIASYTDIPDSKYVADLFYSVPRKTAIGVFGNISNQASTTATSVTQESQPSSIEISQIEVNVPGFVGSGEGASLSASNACSIQVTRCHLEVNCVSSCDVRQGGIYFLETYFKQLLSYGNILIQYQLPYSTVVADRCYFKDGGTQVYSKRATSVNSSVLEVANNSIAIRAWDGSNCQITQSKLIGLGANSKGISLGDNPINSCKVAVSNCDISSFGTAISASGGTICSVYATTGTSNTTGISAKLGAQVGFDATTTLTGTSEVNIDGHVTTMAVISALSPKAVRSSTYDSLVYNSDTIGADRVITYGSAAPVAGTWAVGDIVYNSVPAPGSVIGWVCTGAGTPGTWKSFGPINT